MPVIDDPEWAMHQTQQQSTTVLAFVLEKTEEAMESGEPQWLTVFREVSSPHTCNEKSPLHQATADTHSTLLKQGTAHATQLLKISFRVYCE